MPRAITKQRKMTIAEYKAWVASRGDDAALWDRSKCYAADYLVRNTALKNFANYSRRFPEPIRSYLCTMVMCHFGSVETDDLLTQLGMYPDWIVPNA